MRRSSPRSQAGNVVGDEAARPPLVEVFEPGLEARNVLFDLLDEGQMFGQIRQTRVRLAARQLVGRNSRRRIPPNVFAKHLAHLGMSLPMTNAGVKAVIASPRRAGAAIHRRPILPGAHPGSPRRFAPRDDDRGTGRLAASGNT
jgi:hypothetical protein